MNRPRSGPGADARLPVYFDDCVALFKRHESYFARHYGHAILIGLGVVGQLNEQGQRGSEQTFMADLFDAQDPAASLRRRIWIVKKKEYGPATPWVRVGRSADNDVVIPDYSISRAHCEFRITDAGAMAVYDLGSHNGTHVGGHAIPERFAFEVMDQDEIILGRYGFEYLSGPTFLERVKTAAG